jgi:hypothetical protein
MFHVKTPVIAIYFMCSGFYFCKFILTACDGHMQWPKHVKVQKYCKEQ